MRKILTVCLIIVMIIGSVVPSYAEKQTVRKGYYPISSSSAEWKSYTTAAEMRNACHLDESLLCDLPTVELLRAVLEYPLIVDMMLFNTKQAGINTVAKRCTALRLFLDRDDALGVIQSYPRDLKTLREILVTAPEHIALAPYVLDDLEEYLSEDSLQRAATSLYVYTPNGTPVEVLSQSEYSQAYIVVLNYCHL